MPPTPSKPGLISGLLSKVSFLGPKVLTGISSVCHLPRRTWEKEELRFALSGSEDSLVLLLENALRFLDIQRGNKFRAGIFSVELQLLSRNRHKSISHSSYSCSLGNIMILGRY